MTRQTLPTSPATSPATALTSLLDGYATYTTSAELRADAARGDALTARSTILCFTTSGA